MIWSLVLLAQTPKPVLQNAFKSDITDLHISEDKKHFITVEGNLQSIGGLDIKLWDYESRIIISQLYFDSQNGVGSGKIKLLNDGIMMLAGNWEIDKTDLLNNISEPIFKVEFPEYIHDFIVKNDTLWVATKVYDSKNKSIDDITNQSILYNYDVRNKKIIAKRSFDFEIPSLSYNSKKETLLVGSNKGDILFLDTMLNDTRPKLSVFKNKAIRFMHLSENGELFVNAGLVNERKSYDTKWGEGHLEVFNLDTNKSIKSIDLIKQKVPGSSDNNKFDIGYLPSNMVKDIIVKNDTELFISYGFSRIGQLDLETLELSEIGPKDFEFDIGKVKLNLDTEELLVSYGKVSMFTGGPELLVYNFDFKNIVFDFDNSGRTIEARTIIPIQDNYYFTDVTEKGYKGMDDSVVLQSLINQNKYNLNFKGSNVTISRNSGFWIVISSNNKRVFIGKPTSNLLNATDIEFTFSNNDENILTLNKQSKFNKVSYFNFENLDVKYYLKEILEFLEASKKFVVRVRKKDNTYLAILNADGSIFKLFDDEFGRSNFILSKDGKHIAITQQDSKNMQIEVFNATSWESLFSYTLKRLLDPDASFDKSGKYFYFQTESIDSDGDQTYTLNEVDLASATKELRPIHKGEYYANNYVDREKNLLYLNNSSYMCKINFKDNKTIYEKPSSFSHHPTFYDESLEKIIVYDNEFITLFDENSDSFSEFYFFPDDQIMKITDQNYYMVSPNFPLKRFGFTIGKKGYSFSQFDMLYNRPDKVLEFLKFPPNETVALYKTAYIKRLAQHNLNIEDFSLNINNLPKTEIIAGNITFTTLKKEHTINIKFEDEKLLLKSYNIWVNGVSYCGKNGQKIEGSKSSFQTEIVIPLSIGNNKIEVSCTNENGLESLRKSMNIHYDAKEVKGDLIFVGIGVSKYKDSNYDLSYAAKDARDMKTYMDHLKDKFNKIEAITLIDEEVTVENVLNLKTQLQKTNVEDKVIVFFAGHGVLDKDFNYYIATHNMDFQNPANGGLSYEKLDGLLDGIPARQKLLLIDACHSGEIDKESVAITEVEIEDSSLKIGYRGAQATAIGVNSETVQNAFQLMQNTFSDLRLGTGTTVISSSSGLEYAYEGKTWNNGVFTYALLEGLKSGKIDLNGDKSIKISEIKNYVSDEVYKLTNGNQKPNSRSLNVELDWSLY